jgi:hypothetical protein
MSRMKSIGTRSGIIVAASASWFFFCLNGCAQLPFGHSDPPADDSTVSATAAPAMVAGASPESSVPGGALVQTTTMPGTTPATVPPHLALTVPSIPAPPTSPAATTIPLGAGAAVKAEMKKFVFHSSAEETRYNQAAAKFPEFCHEWQRMLHDRETNSLDHLVWETRNGVQSTTYTGYGNVDSCETKESIEGVPIGKLSYMEMIYNLEGKTPEEARHTPPKIVHQTHTLEIFSWEKNKWFY